MATHLSRGVGRGVVFAIASALISGCTSSAADVSPSVGGAVIVLPVPSADPSSRATSEAIASAPIRFSREVVVFGVVDQVHALATGPQGPILMGVRSCCNPVLWTRTADAWTAKPTEVSIGNGEAFDLIAAPEVILASFDRSAGGQLVVGGISGPMAVVAKGVDSTSHASLRGLKDGRIVVAFSNGKHELWLAVGNAGRYEQRKVAEDAARPRLAIGPSGQISLLASVGKRAVLFETQAIDSSLRETWSSAGMGSDVALADDGTLLVLAHTSRDYTLATRRVGGSFEDEVLPLGGGWMGGRLAVDKKGRVIVAAEQYVPGTPDAPAVQTLRVVVRDPGQQSFVRADLGKKPIVLNRAPTVAFDASGHVLVGAVISNDLTLLTELRSHE